MGDSTTRRAIRARIPPPLAGTSAPRQITNREALQIQTRYSAPGGEVKAKTGSCPVGYAPAAGYSFFRNSSA